LSITISPSRCRHVETSHEYESVVVSEEHGLSDEVRDGAISLRDYPGSDEVLIVSRPSRTSPTHPSPSVFRTKIVPERRFQLGHRFVRAVTWRTFPPCNPWWKGGPVLALWPNSTFLGKLHDHGGLRALCVIVGSMDDLRAWIAATPARSSVGAPV
jgi:hypothetical protein